jgi:hypothetical protein
MQGNEARQIDGENDMTAFFMESKSTHTSLEGAMDWVIDQAKRFGMTGQEAEAKGYAQIFNN